MELERNQARTSLESLDPVLCEKAMMAGPHKKERRLDVICENSKMKMILKFQLTQNQ